MSELDEAINQINKKIETLDLLIAANLNKIAQYGTVAPTTIVPAFKGQVYIKTDTQKAYIAYGVAAGEWVIVN